MKQRSQTADTAHRAAELKLEMVLRRIASGDQAALAELYRLTSARLNGVIWRFVLNRAMAEEVLQDVYVNVWRKASTFDAGHGSPTTWLMSIARNRAIDRLRAEKVRVQPSEDIADIELAHAGASALDAMVEGETTEALLRCLDRLGPDQQRAIRAAFFRGSTYSELADAENVPLSTMKSRIRRALMQLRKCIEYHDGE
jgi:RNA polymerase sigma-70 factor (ECF subfamily)